MFYREILRILGVFCLGFAGVLLLPLALAIHYRYFVDPTLHPQPYDVFTFLGTIAVCLIFSGIFLFFGRKAEGQIYRKEGLTAVVLIWALSPVLGGLPFYLGGTLENPVAAYFEAASGLTTTGATTLEAKRFSPETGKEIPVTATFKGVINTTYSYYGTVNPVRDPFTHEIVYEGVEAVGKALLFWRSFLQWLGGGGIVVLFIAIMPVLGAGGKVLFQAEVPGPVKDSLTPRISETAAQLWKIYLFLTLAQTLVLMTTSDKMEWLDAITVTFSTLSTGGFSIRNENIAFYNSVSTESVVILFMILGSINFSLYYQITRGKLYRLYEPEFITYMIVLIAACSLGTWCLLGSPEIPLNGVSDAVYQLGSAFRYGSFQIISAITSTGFVTANYDPWPYKIQVLMLVVMFIGGMSGSTAGGIKIIRHYMMFKISQYQVEGLFRPEAVRNFKLGKKEVDISTTRNLFCYFVLCVFCSVLGTYLYVLNGEDPETAIGLAACMINNIGLAFRIAGPKFSCAFMDDFAYMVSSFLMIVGRLEFMAVFALFVPAFWREN